MQDKLQSLKQAEDLAWQLFREIEERGLIQPGMTESALNAEIYALAAETMGITKFWHKRIVRAGENTLKPYAENPPDLVIQADDILFLDFGPVFEDWEADIGKTYVLGNDPDKLRLKTDIETAWYQAKAWFDANDSISGAELHAYVDHLAKAMGWEQGGYMAGHNIGHFPHERLNPGDYGLYIHKENHNDMKKPSALGIMPQWI